MKILITAGGTSEPIDAVRTIKNEATGKLSALIAEALLHAYPESEIYYVHDQKAQLPSGGNVRFYQVTTVDELARTMRGILTEATIDIVIHAMAVSDYKTKVAFGEANLQALFAKWNKEHQAQMTYNDFISLLATVDYDVNEKIESKDDFLFITLQKTAKIIEQIKQWSPKTQLIGFKLLNDVPVEKLIDVAYQQLIKNDEVLVVANDKCQIDANKHKAYIINRAKKVIECDTKAEIAQKLIEKIALLEEIK